jgi:Spy/CpxP family protein refolding chaperone
MRGLCKVSLALGLAVLVASPAMAQGGPGGRGGGLGMLLTNKSVQEELKLDKAQEEKLTAAFEKFREDNKDDFAKLRDRNTSREDREAVMKKVGEGSKKIAADVLKPEQMKRLKQIQVQQEGVRAFANPEVEKDLKLTDKQKDELKTIAEDLQKQQREIFQNAGGNREEARKKMTDLRKEKMDAALKVLTDEQKKTYKELTGAPFEVKFEQRRSQ